LRVLERDGNLAEKLLHIFKVVFTESFNVIVPNLGKSAARSNYGQNFSYNCTISG
jgi:hypothetical protein